jgi:ABC-type spermidine/putrescine transport system permease subunit II
MKSAWFRGLLFLILFAPVVVVVWLGHSTAWLVVFAALGLAMSIYNEALNDIGFFTRSAWRSNENGYEQTELMRIFGFLFGAGLYVTTLVFAISLYRHH